jgi:thiamine monophosphate kinase
MSIFKRKIEISNEDKEILATFKEEKRLAQEQKEREERFKLVMCTDPWNFDLIKKIAKETDMNFELVNQTTGQILRFYKDTDVVELSTVAEENARKEGLW